MKYKSKAFLPESEMRWEPAGVNVIRQIMGYDDNLMAVKVLFEKGSEGAIHTHPHTQVSYIVSGRFEVNLGGEKREMEGGDSYYVAPDLEHGVQCLDKGIIIDMFSPVREDFLK